MKSCIYKYLSNDKYFPEEWHWLYLYGIRTSYIISTYGRIYSTVSDLFLKPYIGVRKNGKKTYQRVNLHIFNDKGDWCQRKFSIHRLVAMTFIPNINNKPQVNHIDGNIFNNKVNNLEWSTARENVIHSHQMKLTNPRKGSKHPNTIWNEADVEMFCSCIAEGYNINDTFMILKNKLSTTEYSFKKFKIMYYNIKQRKAWQDISNKYIF